MAECYFHDPNQISKSFSDQDLFRLCANTDLQRESIFAKGPATCSTTPRAKSPLAANSASKKPPGEGKNSSLGQKATP